MSDLTCIIQLMGGLGNQLFQYALGRTLQIERGAQVRYDASLYSLPGERALTLQNYCVHVPRTSLADRMLMRVSFGRTLGRLRPLAKVCGNSAVLKLHTDPRRGFDEEVMELKGYWYLRGWWQCPTYFENIRDVLLNEFLPREPLSGPNLQLHQKIEDSNAVCVHVRRGDLVSSPIYSKICKVQDSAYFSDCMAEVGSRVVNPHYFIFSDDPDWCRQNVKSDGRITYVDNNFAQKDYIDLFLMSGCRHFITANSTFSWWAAWLSMNSEKIVIVPPVWGQDGSGPPAKLIPAGWQVGLQPDLDPQPEENGDSKSGFLTQSLPSVY
jgi:hypothetical protein